MYLATDPFPKKEPYCHNESYRRHNPWSLSRPTRSSYMELSPTGRSTIPSGERASIMDWISTAGDKFSSSPHGELNRYTDLRGINQNSVDIDRIRLGLDVRTTVCVLISIPCYWTCIDSCREDHATQYPKQNRPGGYDG